MKSKVPFPLLVLSVFGLLGCFFGLFLLISPPVQRVGRSYALYLSVAFVFRAVLFSGLLMMRKWAVWGLLLFSLLDQSVCLYFRIWNPSTLLPPLTVVFCFFYYRRME
jgi:hypothetical protein